MIEHVVRQYLDGLKRERDFDVPFKHLLSEMGFEKVHFTHGTAEFGKDFIAQMVEDGVLTQFSFQVKKGDINLTSFRNDVQGQMLQSVTSALPHPGFDTGLPHQPILVVTGDLTQQTNMAVSEQNAFISGKLRQRPYKVWQKTELVDLLVRFGLSSTYTSLTTGVERFGRFFTSYARVLSGEITSRQIEEFSRTWIPDMTDSAEATNRHFLQSSLEVAILSQGCEAAGLMYEAVYLEASFLRTVCFAQYWGDRYSHLIDDFDLVVSRMGNLLDAFVLLLDRSWIDRSKGLSGVVAQASTFLYEIVCARTTELVALCALLTRHCEYSELATSLLTELYGADPGCCHPISDYYLPSTVLGITAYAKHATDAEVEAILCKTAIWICDRYEVGIGLASVDSTEAEEVFTLFGYGLDLANIVPRRSSVLATALLDLSAVLNHRTAYAYIRNNIEATGISPEYYLAKDTMGSCLLDGEDVVHIPAMSFPDWLPDLELLGQATTLQDYNARYTFAEALGPESSYILTFVLRDRYFKAYWS